MEIELSRRGTDASGRRKKTDDEIAAEDSIKQWAELDISVVAVKTASSVVRQRPVLVSAWAFGLFLAAFAGGMPVDEVSREAYSTMIQQAEIIESRNLGGALDELQREEDAYNQARGWFGACDDRCQKAYDKVQMARAEVQRMQMHRDRALTEARKEVGIWSAFGVQDVRDSFWSAWKSGKDFASRCTMMDALLLTMRAGGRDDNFLMMMVALLVRYLLNLTVGLIGAFFFFVYNVYCLIVSYGESVLSGLAFLLLATVAGMATVGTYLCGLYGAVVGGGAMLMQHAAQRALADASRQPQKRLTAPSRAMRPNPRCPV
eukprot:gnl/TRDRNA2_/TRDRNA2_43190_c0_seq1.p1 gnl/TRDRNA2_/TRDRNA2_43190_c0~~gnl/TRDRNA2_/TRDRNA2_43190_c0_seq1.p1  ORF type:complete len:337 (+),score=60.41 gnl/TRDRNA2_/TRDRNA2_43190_c0_seq1:59-1012(+)